MRILHVNKYNFLKGGADKYFLECSSGLAERGHAVARFSMRHPRNEPDPHEAYFAENTDYDAPFGTRALKDAFRLIYNRDARKRFAGLLDMFRPDIIHVHNIYHQISPSVLSEAHKRGLRVVMHLHDYKLLCPNYRMYARGRICELCKGGKFHNCLFKRCVKDSFLKSALAALEMFVHHKLMDIYASQVDLFIAPSEFMADKVRTWRPDIKNIEVLPYFIEPQGIEPQGHVSESAASPYFIFVGRIVREKGIETLIRAYARAKDEAERKAIGLPDLKIVGDGPDKEKLKRLAARLRLNGRVKFTGMQKGEALAREIAGSLAMVTPSEWYEVFGIVNLEAAELGKPVIASRIGGIGEAVLDGATGLLFDPGDEKKLAASLIRLASDQALARRLGDAGRVRVLEKFGPDAHLSRLEEIYRSLSGSC